jgi:hypothetical protein
VRRLQVDIAEEIKRKEEPLVTIYSLEDDSVYQERIGKDEQFDDSDEEMDGTAPAGGTGRGSSRNWVSKKEYERVKSDFARVLQELEAGKKKEILLQEKLSAKEKELKSASPQMKARKAEKEREAKKVDAELNAMLSLMGR